MGIVYPRAAELTGLEKRKAKAEYRIDTDRDIAIRVVAEMEENHNWSVASSVVVDGSYDHEGAKRVWDGVLREKAVLESISPATYKTETGFKAALSAKTKLLSVTKWYAGILAQHGVTNWLDLKAKLAAAGI